MSRDVLYLSAGGEQWFADGRSAPVAVIADFVEEALVRATLPRVAGRDARSLIGRRLQQEFRGTHYRTAYRVGHGRAPKTMDYVFLGLPVPATIDAHLAALDAQGRATAGVWTVTLLVDHWLRSMRVHAPTLLIVLPTPAGVRHVFVEKGRPVLSRLVPALGDGAAELARTVQYLYNARLVERGSEIPTWFCGHADAPPRVEGLRADVPAASRGHDVARDGITALLALAAHAPASTQLAPDALRLPFLAWRMRRGIAIAAGVASLALLGVAFMQAGAMQASRRAASDLSTQANAARSEIAAVQARYASVHADAQTVRDAIAAHRTLIEGAPSIDEGLERASIGFDLTPGYRLDTLRWRIADANAPPSADATAGGCPAPAVPAADGTMPAAPATLAGIDLEGRLSPSLALRDAVVARERFESAYRGLPRVQLAGRRAPIDASGAGVIRGGGASDGDDRAFGYCLQIEGPA